MILITGGNGFQGQPLCDRLTALGEQVVAISRHPIPTDRYVSIVGDVNNKEQLAQILQEYSITAIIHLVSLLNTQSRQNPDKAVRVNVISTLNLLELCKQMGIRRFVYGSSYNAMGYHDLSEGPIREDQEPTPNDFYGETKRYIEKLGIAYGDLNDIEFVSARLPTLLGPGKPVETSAWRMDVYNKLADGGSVDILFGPEEVVPLADIADCADAMAFLVRGERPRHHIYNIPSESMSARQLGELAQKVSGKLQVNYGDRKVNGIPLVGSSERLKQEYNYQPKSIEYRLREFKEGKRI
ncbi:MAG: NAD(P)-dependent oxidoreductase [Chloroflexi bacterium]|jgi:nucleoside-diphosphate-sugar epimerase|nr:NAD(P)-dependent oxidoreductase [Anaerolineaceae bacterium]NMB88178.1 NAD(P)-dependent oxidoreductase [Chloroflexota bacterium]